MTEKQETITAMGGFCAPLYLHDGFAPPKRGDTYFVTYPVQGRLRRWWFRRTGWSTEWTQEHTWVPLTDVIPSFTATRGGISFK